eukprot:1790022-Prymnesium_polylepis.3
MAQLLLPIMVHLTSRLPNRLGHVLTLQVGRTEERFEPLGPNLHRRALSVQQLRLNVEQELAQLFAFVVCGELADPVQHLASHRGSEHEHRRHLHAIAILRRLVDTISVHQRRDDVTVALRMLADALRKFLLHPISAR